MSAPLITVGIPVYNGARTIKRAIDSALDQSYPNVEVVVSDNASTDRTGEICEQCAAADSRVKYVRQQTNVGPVENFRIAFSHARGELYMWLGDDDWLDLDYLQVASEILTKDPSVALVAGRAQYYRDGQPIRYGKKFSITDATPLRRVVSYLHHVKDNGIFHGLMRRADIPPKAIPYFLAGDWLVIASQAYRGKLLTLDEIVVHRDLGGASKSRAELVSTLRLPPWTARFPSTAIMVGAFQYFLRDPEVATDATPLSRLALSSGAAGVLAVRGARRFAKKYLR